MGFTANTTRKQRFSDAELLAMDVCSGCVEVAELTPDETYALSHFVSERSNRLREAGFALPDLHESSDDIERRLFLINFANYADGPAPDTKHDAYDIDGNWRDTYEQRFEYRRFRQAHVDFATEKTYERVTNRLRQALAPFKLTEKQLERTVGVMAKNPSFYLVDEGSPLFDFDQKVSRTVELLNKEGANLSKNAYVKACLEHPQLFTAVPETIVLNLIGKGKVGETERSGFVTMVNEKSHKTMTKFDTKRVGHTTEITCTKKVVGFSLSLERYVKACLANPRLFTSDPKTIMCNLVGRGVVRGEKRTGLLTLLREQHNVSLRMQDYLEACLSNPQLFTSDPNTIMLNLAGKGEVHGEPRTGLITLLKEKHDINVPLKRYIDVCLTAPRLFARNPETICHNISIVLDIAKHLNETGHVFPKQNKIPQRNERQLRGNALIMDRLFKTPFVLALNPENLELRKWYAEYKSKDREAVSFSIFTDTREKAESTIIKALGGEPGQPVEKKFTEEDMDNWDSLSKEAKQEKANSMMLRTLIRAGIITHATLAPGKDTGKEGGLER